MFTNLKNKLLEEVKASPSKFQQLANAAQAAVSSSSGSTSSSSETNSDFRSNVPLAPQQNFFSITEDDTPQNSPLKHDHNQNQQQGLAGSHLIRQRQMNAAANRNTSPGSTTMNNGTSSGHGFRTRKLSNCSSVASDMSFRLPHYDANSSNYHLPSDMEFEESGSEMGDTVSTTTKLDVISKEKLYTAYRTTIERYQKYRNRYLDLVTKYRDLERDSSKARTVLIETQEKAMRRISELREQCVLEQQAKAHLEEALRMEMDDMQCKMQSYQMKLKLLGVENADAPAKSSNSIVASENSTSSAKEERMNDESENEINSKNTDSDLLRKIEKRDEQIKQLQEKLELQKRQEEADAIFLAQTKAALHTELEAKESEVTKLTLSMKDFQKELQTIVVKDQQIKALSEEVAKLKDTIKEKELSKKEVDAKLITKEHLFNDMRRQLQQQEGLRQELQEKIAIEQRGKAEQTSQIMQQKEELKKLQSEIDKISNSFSELKEESQQKELEHEQEKKSLRDELAVILNDISKDSIPEERKCSGEELDENEERMDVAELLKETQIKFKSLEKEYKDNLEKSTCVERNLVEAESLIKEKDEKLQQLREEQINLNTYLKELQEKLNKVEQERQDLEAQYRENDQTSTEKELRMLREANVEVEQSLQKEKECSEGLVKQYEELKLQLESKLVEFEEKSENWFTERQELTSKLRLLEEKEKKLLEDVRLAKEQQTVLEEQSRVKQTEKLKVLESKNDELKVNYDLVVEQLKEKEATGETLQKSLKDAKETIEKKEFEINNLLESVKQLQCVHKESEDLKSILVNKQKELEAEILEYKENYETLRTSNDKLQEEKIKDEEMINFYQKEIQMTNKELNETVEERKSLKILLKEMEHSKTESVEKVQKDLKELQVYVNSLDDEIKDLRARESNHQAEMERRQKELLRLEELEMELTKKNNELQAQEAYLSSITEEKNTLEDQFQELKSKYEEELQEKQKNDLKNSLESVESALESSTVPSTRNKPTHEMESETEHLRSINERLHSELEELRSHSIKEISSLQLDLEDAQNSNRQLHERIMDLERLKAGLQAQRMFRENGAPIAEQDTLALRKIEQPLQAVHQEELEVKLKSIMEEVQDVSNRNLFLEQKCENYLILEQSNERLKLQNAKLSRQLDETLVSLQHGGEGAAINTEFEYLKNIMFQYLTGTTNGNSETLVKVISAVLKFSPQQTQVALEKEHQKRSLLSKIL